MELDTLVEPPKCAVAAAAAAGSVNSIAALRGQVTGLTAVAQPCWSKMSR